MTAGKLGYAAEAVELCLETGDIPCEIGDMPWDELGECPEVYDMALDEGVNAGVPAFD